MRNYVTCMKYVATGISPNQILRFLNTLEDSLNSIEDGFQPNERLYSELPNADEDCDQIVLNSTFVEIVHQYVLGFRVNLIEIHHKGLIKEFINSTTREVIQTIVLIDNWQICES